MRRFAFNSKATFLQREKGEEDKDIEVPVRVFMIKDDDQSLEIEDVREVNSEISVYPILREDDEARFLEEAMHGGEEEDVHYSTRNRLTRQSPPKP